MERWKIAERGHIYRETAWEKDPHYEDHMETSGQGCSLYLWYGTDREGRLLLRQEAVFPGLRLVPNNTHGSLRWKCPQEQTLFLRMDGEPLRERVERMDLDGILSFRGAWQGVEIRRRILPSRFERYALEQVTLENRGDRPVELTWDRCLPEHIRGAQGVYVLERKVSGRNGPLAPGEKREITAYFTARRADQEIELLSAGQEVELRRDFLRELGQSLVLETPEPELDNAFALAKIRAAESVFRTKGGLIHCPGGLDYYAAVWANDQVEYAGPFFPYLGEKNAVEASKTAYEWYLPFMSDGYLPLPSSIIAEGLDIWTGAGDRGDAALYAYGASAFLLALGDRDYAEKMLPAVEWCLEYCRRRTTKDGVIASDTDELENRFSSGDANLSTSCLTYGGLILAAELERELGREEQRKIYLDRAKDLEQAVENYFGAWVEGYDTYRYHEGNEKLRAWICLPLVFRMGRRQKGTIEALLSDRLRTADGLATESGDTVFWDRSTLYALRGLFRAGQTEEAAAWLTQYSRRRTLGDHVPYPVEAWPEGNQRHLSAESALYCRIYTEGLFGMEPVGFRKFRLRPRLPEAWDHMALRQCQAFGNTFDLELRRRGEAWRLSVITADRRREYTLAPGEEVTVDLSEGEGRS